jgi:hypothetical protein
MAEHPAIQRANKKHAENIHKRGIAKKKVQLEEPLLPKWVLYLLVIVVVGGAIAGMLSSLVK